MNIPFLGSLDEAKRNPGFPQATPAIHHHESLTPVATGPADSLLYGCPRE